MSRNIGSVRCCKLTPAQLAKNRRYPIS